MNFVRYVQRRGGLSEFGVLGVRALSALMCGLRSRVPRGHVLGYIRARVLVIVPLRVCRGPQQTRRFHPS